MFIKALVFAVCFGGEKGIRTLGGLTSTPVFKTGALNQLDHLSRCRFSFAMLFYNGNQDLSIQTASSLSALLRVLNQHFDLTGDIPGEGVGADCTASRQADLAAEQVNEQV